MLRDLVTAGLLAHPIRGAYHAVAAPDSLDLRLAVLALVVPSGCVITDVTAAWVWQGDRVLPPGSHVAVPQPSVFCPPGRRLRNDMSESGERSLGESDVVQVEDVAITTPLRTACDVGRLEHRDLALGIMDAMADIGRFGVAELMDAVPRFKGYRGVVQLRSLAPIVDSRSASIPEAALRLRWIDADLPRPECQVPVPSPTGGLFYVDVGLPESRMGAEYFGEAYHDETVQVRDVERVSWMIEHEDWGFVVARKHNLYGPHQDVIGSLRRLARERGVIP